MGPSVYITPEAKLKLDAYIHAVTTEISGIGKAVVRNGSIHIDDVYLLKQESAGSETELDQQDIAEFMMELMQKGEDVGALKVWWHSHAGMSCFWSATDKDTAAQFGNGWMVSVVGNLKGEYKCRIDIYDPVYVAIEDVAFAIALPAMTEELRRAIEEEVKEKVKQKTHFYGGYTGNGVQQGISGFIPGGNVVRNENVAYPGWRRNANGVWEKYDVEDNRRDIMDITDEEIEQYRMWGGGW
jgi:proteasome lid subunit RPN8/RPN11